MTTRFVSGSCEAKDDDIESIIDGHDRDDDDTSVYSYVLLQLEDQLEQQFRHPQHPTYHPSARRRVHPHHDHGQLDNSFSISIVTASSAWQYIPSDVIYLIASHLDGRSLARLSSCDRTCRSVINQHQQRGVTLWRHLTTDIMKAKWHAQWMNTTIQREIVKQLKGSKYAHLTSASDPRGYYAARYTLTLRQARMTKRKIEKQKQRVIEIKQVAKGRWIEEVAGPSLLMILFTIFLAFLTIELHSSTTGHVSFLTMWPLSAIMTILLLSFLHLLYVRWIASRIVPTSDIDESEEKSDSSSAQTLILSPSWRQSKCLMKSFIKLVEGGRKCSLISTNQNEVRRVHLSLFAAVLSFAVWLVLLSLRVTHTFPSLSWNIVWSPIYLMFTIIICGVHFFNWFYHAPLDSTIERFHICSRGCVSWKVMLCILPPFSFFLFLQLYFIDLIPRLLYALLPLTFFHLVVFLWCGPIYLISECHHHRMRDPWFGEFPYSTWLMFMIGWLLVPAPLLVTQILLTFKIDDPSTVSYSWQTVFVPLISPFTILSICVLFWTYERHRVLMGDLKRNQEDEARAESNTMNFDLPGV